MATPQPTPEIQASPGTWNLAYGPNQFTVVNTGPGTPKFVLQIWTADGITKIAEVRQQGNLAGVAHFDVAKILQGQVIGNQSLTGEQIDIVTSENEVFEYIAKAGFVNTQGIAVITDEVTGYKVINGRKRFDDLTWANQTQWISRYTQQGSGLHTRTRQADWLTDWNNFKNISSFTDGVPGGLNNDTQVQVHDIEPTDYFTLSAINEAQLETGGADDVLPIGRFRIVSFNGSTQLDDITVDNLLGDGGGPNYVQCINQPNEQPYWCLSFPCGPAQIFLSSGWTHYYVWAVPVSTTILGCTGLYPMLYAHRFNRYEGECNDYSHVQVSWLNSLGFRDYFSFDKRHDQNLTVKRNEYYEVPGTWNSGNFNINNYDRGRRVFSQQVEETWTLTSRYLTEDEYLFLKNMILSPDIQVRFEAVPEYSSDEWMAATIQTSRWTDLSYRKQKMFQMQLEIKIANNIETQRG
jgi:hypothetical protein